MSCRTRRCRPTKSIRSPAWSAADAQVDAQGAEALIGDIPLDDGGSDGLPPDDAPAHDAVPPAEEDSVEDYMRKLLARMRGEDEPPAPTAPKPAPVVDQAPPAVAVAEPSPTTDFNAASAAPTGEVTAPFDPEKYIPRALAPERTQHIAAMRALANSSARTAIHRSTRQRYLNSVLIKVGIAAVGLTVGTVLLFINGFTANIGLVAMVTSYLVAAIWGYDAGTSIKPLLQAGLILQPEVDPPSDKPDAESTA